MMSFDLVQVIDIPFNGEIETPGLIDARLPNFFSLTVFFGLQEGCRIFCRSKPACLSKIF